jgi:hypothetical protein
MIKKILLTVLAVSTTLGFSLNASAIDWKSEPGAKCQAYFGNQETLINKYAGLGAYNTSAGNVWVNCPVIRDNVTNTNGTAGTWVWINQTATQSTRCFNRSAQPSGANVQTVNGTRTGSGWLYIRPTVSVSLGTYDIYCSLPTRASVSTVLNTEYPDTNAQ